MDGCLKLVHDDLEETNDPVYFHEFIQKAEDHGLQFMVESDPVHMNLDNFEGVTHSYIKKLGGDRIQSEQYSDFFNNRMFRQTLLCHSSHELHRGYAPEKIKKYFISLMMD